MLYIVILAQNNFKSLILIFSYYHDLYSFSPEVHNASHNTTHPIRQPSSSNPPGPDSTIGDVPMYILPDAPMPEDMNGWDFDDLLSHQLSPAEQADNLMDMPGATTNSITKVSIVYDNNNFQKSNQKSIDRDRESNPGSLV